jgi:hypothetical protein
MSPEAVEHPEPVEPPEMPRNVPDEVREAARRAFDARRRDVHIADLVFDSLLDGDSEAIADPSRRSLRFGSADAGADVTVTEVDEVLTVVVNVLPAQKCEIEIQFRDTSRTVTTSDAGQVEFTAQPGLMSLVIRPTRSPHAQPLQTAWVRV